MAEQNSYAVRWNFFAGVGLTSLCTLMLQVSLTRVFSVALWHHFAFMVVSIAFLGFAGSGTFLMMVPRISMLRHHATLSYLALGFSMATLAAYGSSNAIPFDPARIIWDRYQWVYLLGYYGVLAVPFFFAGLILGLVYTSKPAAVNRLYACDLVGAGIGCAVVLIVYAFSGEVGSILFVCLVACLASLCFCPGGWRVNAIRGPWMILVCFCFFFRPGFLALNISPYKALSAALRYPDARILETHRDLSTRLDVIESGAVHFSPGLSLEFEGKLPEQLGLCLDAGHLNAVTRFTGDPDDLLFTEDLPASLPYAISEPKNVLIMDPLGGLDILIARHHGVENITTTHSNPLVLGVLRDSLADFSGRLYQEGVTAVQETGRGFLRRNTQRFDVIQLPLTDSVGAASSGLYGLSEEYTLTVEAFQAYLGALTSQGLLTVTKYLLPPPRHELRLAALAVAALRRMGVTHPDRHIAAIRSWGAFTLLVKKTPLEAEQIERIKAFCHRLRFDVVAYPGMPRREANRYNRFPSPLYHDMIQKILHPAGDEVFFDSYLFDVRPVTDDRPFFYHNFKMDKVVFLYRAVGKKWQLFLEGGYLVHLILFQAVIIALLLVALPLTKGRIPVSPRFLIYFGLIGTAFMLTEVCLIQRFILFLARPAYAFSAVLFSMLTASGLGSYYSKKMIVHGENGQLALKKFSGGIPFLALAPVLLLAYVFFLAGPLTMIMAGPLWMRHALTFVIIMPLGFVTGMFFPVGVRVLSLRNGRAIPWAWAVNASASVVGSVLAVVIALSWGFTTVLCLAAVAYGLAVLILPVIGRAKN